MSVMVKRPTDPASPAQVNFLRDLLDKRDLPEHDADRLRNRIAEGTLDKGTASLSIQYLKARPFKNNAVAVNPAHKRVTEPGIYEHDGKIYRVKWNRSKTNMYAQVATLTIGEAKRLTASGDEVNFEYIYAPGAFSLIDASHRITGQRAEELAVIFTKCIVCNRRLKASTSVKAGIGPVCIKKV